MYNRCHMNDKRTEFVTTIDSRGSINIPKAIRAVGFKTGTRVKVEIKVIEQLSDLSESQEKQEDKNQMTLDFKFINRKKAKVEGD